MLILRKRFSDPSDIYEELKTVLGSRDIIINSMEQYLISINRTIDSLNGNGIVLCNHNNNQTIEVKDSDNTHSYSGTITGFTNTKPIADLTIGNDNAIGEIRDVDEFKQEYTKYSTSINTHDNCCYTPTYDIAVNYINKKYNFDSYDQFVDWAICVVQMNRPSPFSLEYPNAMHTLHLNKDNFVITFPNNIGFGIIVAVREGSIVYDVDIIYNGTYANQTLFKENDVYKTAIKNKWEYK